MEKTLVVAKFLNDLFKNENGTDVDQMKMHKLMYFAQRESLMYNKEPLFDSEFEGWKYGPVLVEVRDAYKNNCRKNTYRNKFLNRKFLFLNVCFICHN